MFSNYVLSRGNASIYGRSTVGCTFGSRLGTPNPRYLNGLIDEYYRPTHRCIRRSGSSRSRSNSPANIKVRSGSRKASRPSSNRPSSSRASSNNREKNQAPSIKYPPWYNDDDIRRFELVRRIREETSRVPKNSDKYNLVSGLSRPTSANSRNSSRASSRRGSFIDQDQSIWEPAGAQKATRREAQKTIHRLIRAQSRGKKVVFEAPIVTRQPDNPVSTMTNSHSNDASSDSYDIGNAHPRLSTLQFYGKFLGSQALPRKRARRLQSLLDETPVFYAPNGDTVVLQNSENSDSSITDTEHLAHNAISGLMELISEEKCPSSTRNHTRFTERSMHKHGHDISIDRCIDLSKHDGISFADQNLSESQCHLYNQQQVLRPVLESSTTSSSNRGRELNNASSRPLRRHVMDLQYGEF